MIYGYVKSNLKSQLKDGEGLETQENVLKIPGVSEIYRDAYIIAERPEFDKLLEKIESRETLIVTKQNRIARSVSEGSKIIQNMLDKEICVHILIIGKMDNSSTGEFIYQIMFVFAKFEKDICLERIQEGRAGVRKNSNYYEGRLKKYVHNQLEYALKLLENYSYTQVIGLTGISKTTLAIVKNVIHAESR